MMAEMRLFSANDIPWRIGCNDDGRTIVYSRATDVDAMPTIDAVPVVRCRDCKYGVMHYPEKEIGKEAKPRWYCAAHSSSCRPDDFCSY